MQTIGVIADTHVPDRGKEIPEKALEVFRQEQVSLIIHAGDISIKSALAPLEEIAPVTAVRGNRDLLYFGELPYFNTFKIEEVLIGVTHGHGTWGRYIRDRLLMVLHAPKKFSYYEHIARRQLPDARVVVLGHNHAPANYWFERQLIFNPGSPAHPNPAVPNLKPSVGLLRVDGHNVDGEIVFL
jgi:putative phosphoesterase